MMGQQKSERELFSYAVNLEKRVRSDHPLRAVAAAIDFQFVREEVARTYGAKGNVSVDPAVIMKMIRRTNASAAPISRIQSRRRGKARMLSGRNRACVRGFEPPRQLVHDAAAFAIAIGRPAPDLGKASPAAAAKPRRLIDDADPFAGRFDRGQGEHDWEHDENRK